MPTYKALSAIEQVELQEEVKALRQREAELSAYMEELRTSALTFVNDSYRPSPKYDAMRFDNLKMVAEKTPPQSLHDREAKLALRVAEAVREACAVNAWATGMGAFNNGHKYRETREQGAFCADSIRSLNLSDVLEERN